MPAAIKINIFLIIFLACIGSNIQAQQTIVVDSAGKLSSNRIARKKVDSTYNPKIAIVRSAIVPGWGQATNKKYWKIPIVYGALGTSAYFFFHNLKQYKEARSAYNLAIDNDPTNDNQIPEPYYSVRGNPTVIANFRNDVRQNVDYSALFFLAFWGLNVVDAAVDAHLKTFDVSDDLSLQIKPGYSPLANTAGVSIVLHIGK